MLLKQAFLLTLLLALAHKMLNLDLYKLKLLA